MKSAVVVMLMVVMQEVLDGVMQVVVDEVSQRHRSELNGRGPRRARSPAGCVRQSNATSADLALGGRF